MITNTLPVVFFPRGTAAIAATQASGSATLFTSKGVGTNVMVYNEGPDLAFVKLGASGGSVTVPSTTGTGGTPVPVGFFGLTISRDANVDTTCYAICKTGETATVYFTVGNGT